MEEIEEEKICAELYQAQFCLSYQYLGVRDLHILRNHVRRGGQAHLMTMIMPTGGEAPK